MNQDQRDTPSQPMTAAQALEESKRIVIEEGPRAYPNVDRIVQRLEALAARVSGAQPAALQRYSFELVLAPGPAIQYTTDYKGEWVKYSDVCSLPARAQVPKGWKLVRVEILESAANLMEYGRCVTRDDDAASKFVFFRDQLRLAAAPTEEEKP